MRVFIMATRRNCGLRVYPGTDVGVRSKGKTALETNNGWIEVASKETKSDNKERVSIGPGGGRPLG